MKNRIFRYSVLLIGVLFLASCVAAGGTSNVKAEDEIVYPPYDGPKKRIAVLEFENKVSKR